MRYSPLLPVLRRSLRASLKRFALSDEGGSVSIETVLIMPILLWAYVSSFVFFDGFKHHSMNLKAAYTVGDMLSRQTAPINESYLEGMADVFDFLTFQRHGSWLRVSQIRWQSAYNRYNVDWSYATDGNNQARLMNENLVDIEGRLPPMVNGERILLVESFTNYTPAFSVGLSPTVQFKNFVVTSPRFAPQLAMN